MMKKFTTYFALLMIVFIGLANNLNAQNQVSNPGFETWTDGMPNDWTVSGGAISVTQNSTNTHTGSSSCEVLFESQSNQNLMSASFAVTPGQEVNGSVWILDNDDAGRARISVLYDGADNFYGDYSEDNAEWQELAFTETVPAGATTAQFQIRFYDVSASWDDDCLILVDDASFEVNTSVNPEPSEYPTSFSLNINRLDAELTWTDAAGTNLPAGYLLKGSTSDNISAPIDGTIIDNDYDFSDGAISINISQSEEIYNLSMQHGISLNENYYFKIYPYSNGGANIDYKTDGNAPTSNGSTDDLTLVHQEFFPEDIGTWSQYSVIGDEVWEQSVYGGISYVDMSGFSGSAVDNEDWLISPEMNLSTFSSIILSFSSAVNYTGPALSLYYSSDYAGTGNPNDATWNELTATWSDGEFNWVGSGNLNLPSTNGIFLAYKYTSSPDDGAAKWEITNILITAGGGSAAPATQLDITSINGGNAVYENQAFSVTVQAQDDDGAAANVDANLAISLSLGTGSGNLGGTLTGTIAAGTSTVTISGVTYGPHENGVVLNVSGGSLESGSSAPFNVLEVIIPEIVISEIMYKAMGGSEDSLEYIEFYNNGSTAINLENYTMSKGVVHTFGNVSIGSGAYLLLARDADAVSELLGVNAEEWTSNSLSNSGEEIELSDPLGNVVSYVDYGTGGDWPSLEDGKSIRFCNPGLANNDPANWSISIEFLTTIGTGDEAIDIYGTPMASCGEANLVAAFSANTTSIETGQSIDFTDESTGAPTSWSWTFEGGTPSTSTSQNPQDIVYNTAGVYDVILTVSKDGDNNTETKTNYITVVDPITPPVAAFTANLTTIFVGQSVQFTSTSTNDPDTHAWTFEGGTPATSTVQNPSVSYNTAGTFDVSLTVANGGGSDDLVETDYITVLPATLGDLVITEIMYNPPEAGDDILEYIEIYNNSDETVDLMGYNFTAGVEYTFPTMDLASGAYVLVAKDANAVQTVLGITSLQWTSGSLSNTGELIKLSSPTGVTIDSIPYNVSSPWPSEGNGNGPSIAICDPEVENSIGENWHASTHYLTDNAGDAIYGSPGTASAPVASFSADVTSIFITEDVQFTNLSSCNYTSIEWTFEGGTPSTSSDENPLVSYNTEGVFDVTLTVTNAIGSHTMEMTDYIEVIDPTIAPIANFSADLTTIFVGQNVHYTDLSENEPVTYAWTFEGGTPASSSLQNPSVAYNTPGTFSVTLFVENTAGDDEMVKTDYITVLPATVGDLVITEIMYNPPESGDDSLEYIEIYNNSADIVNLMGYTFSDGVEFTFPNIEIAINEYLVLAKSANAMQNTFGVTAIEWTSGSLSNGGELIKLVSASGITVDSVPYSDMSPWPEDGDGTGPSITICDPEAENSVGENWHASVNYLADNTNGDAIYGTPGTAPAAVANFVANDQLPGVGDQVEFTELSTCNAETFEWTFEGGTPESSTDANPIITYAMAGDFDVTLTVSNAIGSHTITMEEYIRVGVGIAEQTLSEISIMPNPSTGLFTLENPSNNEVSVMVFNVLGKLVYENLSILSTEVIDLTREESGIYLLQVSIDGEYKTMRIIKQ